MGLRFSKFSIGTLCLVISLFHFVVDSSVTSVFAGSVQAESFAAGPNFCGNPASIDHLNTIIGGEELEPHLGVIARRDPVTNLPVQDASTAGSDGRQIDNSNPSLFCIFGWGIRCRSGGRGTSGWSELRRMHWKECSEKEEAAPTVQRYPTA